MAEFILPTARSIRASKDSGIVDRLARRGVVKLLSGIRTGRISLLDRGNTTHFGSSSPDFPLASSIRVHDTRFYRQSFLRGSIGAGEAYMQGHWTTDNLTDLIRILLRNRMAADGLDKGWARMSKPIFNLFHAFHRNTRSGSRSNILAHYDLGNDFYGLFLDDTMTYSCGIFETENSSLEAASTAKYDRICRKLSLGPRDHVLEIGTGWGGFALHAAKHYGCRVTTTTISSAQYALASERFREANLDGRIRILKKDYRDLDGRFDKLVSIEMVEAVGHQYYDRFFGKCSELLKPDGIMALQAITIADQAFEQHKHSVDFIKRYIFPGSCIPSVAAMSLAVSRASDLRMFHLEDITSHYARTLRMWRERFFDNLERIKAMGFPDAFVRMWDFYLSYCEAGFAQRYLGNVQMILAKPLYRVAPSLPDPGKSTETVKRYDSASFVAKR